MIALATHDKETPAKAGVLLSGIQNSGTVYVIGLGVPTNTTPVKFSKLSPILIQVQIMKPELKFAAQVIAVALVTVVITQMIYVALGGGGQSHIAYPIWRIEALSAMVVSLLSFVIMSRNILVGGCLLVAGIFNVIQTGMGLMMFYQLGYAGEESPNPVFFPVLRMSFYLYYAAKAALGVAAFVLGLALWQVNANGIWWVVGLLSALAGVGAILLNVAAMLLGLGAVPFAGAIGVVAALFTAAALVRVMSTPSDAA